MNEFLKPLALGGCFVVMMCAAGMPGAPFNLGFVRDAAAGLVVAPVRRTAVATSVASSSANANAAAQQNQAAQANAAAQADAKKAAEANAAAAAAKAGPPPAGTIATTLPPGCAATKLNGVDYERCGSTYYRAQMMGNNLVFVVVQP